MPCVVSLRKNCRALRTLVGGSDTTSGNIASPRSMKSCLTCLQAWAPLPSPALSHRASGHWAHWPPGLPTPVTLSEHEHALDPLRRLLAFKRGDQPERRAGVDLDARQVELRHAAAGDVDGERLLHRLRRFRTERQGARRVDLHKFLHFGFLLG